MMTARTSCPWEPGGGNLVTIRLCDEKRAGTMRPFGTTRTLDKEMGENTQELGRSSVFDDQRDV